MERPQRRRATEWSSYQGSTSDLVRPIDIGVITGVTTAGNSCSIVTLKCREITRGISGLVRAAGAANQRFTQEIERIKTTDCLPFPVTEIAQMRDSTDQEVEGSADESSAETPSRPSKKLHHAWIWLLLVVVAGGGVLFYGHGRAIFANKDNALFPNQFANVRLIVATQNGATLIPTAEQNVSIRALFVDHY